MDPANPIAPARAAEPGRRRRRAPAGVAVTALALAGVAVAACGSAPAAFSWFRAMPAPAEWRHIVLGDGAAFFYPPSLHQVAADPGAASAERRTSGGGYAAYLNVTPWDGPALTRSWAPARIDRLGDENQAVHEDATSGGLAFRNGARGWCVRDHYVTKIGRHPFAETACLVRARTGRAVVVVAAASQPSWAGAQPVLERALEAVEP